MEEVTFALERTPQRVVITGIGAVTAQGRDIETIWKACLSGCSAVSPITLFDVSAYPTRIAAEIKEWDASPWMDKKEIRRMDRFVQFAVAAAQMALEDSGLKVDNDNRDRIGVQIGSGIGGLATLEENHRVLLEKGPGRVSPFLVPGMIADMGAGFVSIALGMRGPNSCVVSACATGGNNIGDAYHIIRRGDADAMMAGGSEAAITPLAMAGFCAARAMTTRNDDPEAASRPFDKGASRSMREGLRTAGLMPADVDYVNAHGTSTAHNDRNETAAIKAALGPDAYRVAVSSTKSMTGHLNGAAGAVEAIFCALAMRDSVLPPTINYTTPDPDCDLDYVPNKPRKAEVRVAMSNSFGFGGHNVTVVLKRFES
jgi:3-oxoacyl-[acyl-carrier-protein] synthase II